MAAKHKTAKRNVHNEANESSHNSAERSVHLFAPGMPPDACNADHVAIGIQVACRYPFLPQPVLIKMEGDRVLLQYPEASDDARAEAARLAERAAQHAGNGDRLRAIDAWQRVLRLVPDNLEARRHIGMACSELGNFTQARRYLAAALLLDSEDVVSLVALANLAIKEGDNVAAELYASKAVAAAPQDAWALNCLGAVLLHTQRPDEALSLFRAAMAADPGQAPPYRAIACLYQHQGRYSEAEATLRAMFNRARQQDSRSEPIFIRARQLYRQVQESIAEGQDAEARRTVEGFRMAAEKQIGCPIRVVEERSSDGPTAWVQLAWQHRLDHHLIRCRSDYPAVLRPLSLAKISSRLKTLGF